MRALRLFSDTTKVLEKLPAKQYRQVLSKILKLPANPIPNDASKLKGEEAYRVTSGEYRIIYSYNDDSVDILAVGKRNDSDVYKKFKRLR